MQRISLTCECCSKVWNLQKTSELPEHIFFMRCNYCLECDMNGKMRDYYKEWWDEDENDTEKRPIPISDNQLCMPFIFDEIGVPKPEEQLINQ